MAVASLDSRGQLVAALLRCSWRRDPQPCECSAAELERVAPLLHRSGAAALGWRRVEHSRDLQHLPAAKELHRAYRLNTLRAARNQQIIVETITLLRSFGIEPILIKGWAAARTYPADGLRPYGDLDLCVRPDQFAAAEPALNILRDKQYEVDLHCGFEKLGGGPMDEVMARTRLVRLEETDVRLLSAEDHLRVLSIHMLREGAWRPLWLCDIAATVESLDPDFNWDRCLTSDQRLAEWVICAIKLARELLGAEIAHTPAAASDKAFPRWLVRTILKEWAAPVAAMTERHRAPMAHLISHPAGLFKGLRHRWPNPIEATVSCRGPFNELPRLPFQIGNCLARTMRFALSLKKPSN